MQAKADAYAKINFTLDILGKREDNYHILKMIMQSVTLYDTITVRVEDDKKITIAVNNDKIPTDSSNTVYKATEEFFKYTCLENPGVFIKIKKRIPSAAGLAGGSADAAAVIVALDELFNTHLNIDKKIDIGERVGADVPFCLHGGTMYAEGIGTTISPLFDCPKCWIVLCKPDIDISTAQAYAQVDNKKEFTHPDTQLAIDSICSNDLPSLANSLGNVFEEVLELDEVSKIKDILLKNDSLGACMSGSGPTVFGLFQDKSSADSAARSLENIYNEVFVCEPVTKGVELH